MPSWTLVSPRSAIMRSPAIDMLVRSTYATKLATNSSARMFQRIAERPGRGAKGGEG